MRHTIFIETEDGSYHIIIPLSVTRDRYYSLCILRNGVTPHIRSLRAIHRDECPRSIVRSEPDKVVERFPPGRRERFGCTL